MSRHTNILLPILLNSPFGNIKRILEPIRKPLDMESHCGIRAYIPSVVQVSTPKRYDNILPILVIYPPIGS